MAIRGTRIPDINFVGGSGSGQSLTFFESLAEQAKQNLAVLALSDVPAFLENFIDPGKFMSFKLGKDYSVSDTTQIYIHPDYLSIDAMDATTGWIAFGAQAGAPSLDTTNKIQGTGSVQCVSSSGTGENGIYKDFTAFSLVGRKLRFAYRIDDLTNVTAIRVRFYNESGETNGVWFDLTTQASGVALVNNASGWNWMEVDVEATPTGTTGSPTFNGIVRVKIAPILSSAQAHTVQIDDLNQVDNREIPAGITMSIYDGTNFQRMVIASGSKGKYVLGATLSNNYLISGSTIKRGKGYIANNRGYMGFDSGDTGAIALRSPFMNRKVLPASVSNKTLQWSCRYQTESFWQVYSAPTSGTVVVKSPADYTTSIPSGTVIWIYRKVWNGSEYDYPGTPQRVTLTAPSTWDGVNFRMTLTHNGSFSPSVASEYWVVVESVEMRAWVGTYGSSELLAQSTPTGFRADLSSVLFKYDSFNRTQSGVGGDWTNTLGSGSAHLIDCTGVRAEMYYSGPAGTSCWANLNDGRLVPKIARFRMKATFLQQNGNGSAPSAMEGLLGITLGPNGFANSNTGMFFGLSCFNSSGITTFQVRPNGALGTAIVTSSSIATISDRTTPVWLDLMIIGNTVKYKYWMDSANEPSAYIASFDIPSGILYNQTYALTMKGGHNSGVFDSMVWPGIEDFTFDSGGEGGFVLSGSVASQTGDTIAIGADLIRASTVNQSPTLHRVAAALF